MPVRAQHEPPHLLKRGLVSEMKGLVGAKPARTEMPVRAQDEAQHFFF